MKPYHFQLIACLCFSLCACVNKEVTQPTTPIAQPLKDKYDILRELDRRVKIEEVPPLNIISLQFNGGYQKHPEAYQQLSSYVSKNYQVVGAILGIYPQDPDLVKEEELEWSISLRIVPKKTDKTLNEANEKDPFVINATKEKLGVSLTSFALPQKPFRLEQLPPITAATLVSDVANIGKDGLAINAWIDMNNYVQTGPTRTEFGNATQESKLIPVKVYVPVKKRIRETL